ncbi:MULTISPECIES: LytR/AlgR family response regulator transcription factor [unclassified Clostridioides]|uniref:LytR/AlgR family response regulator transcription factor n=1 Tax=unclassified Clostridioides TaxID=2635829 RepID=UPI001D11954F|nr:response regulator transcription factor [Clostridioides sp. ZZV14-6150]MCC0723361.1 response regulator transcription factor [Clostridioides sp. ZZV14-6104]MCC0742777.1 response regulator transcription factor [Clostridioides sp. ZZV14-6044]MCC0751268.1 response regulator transcription factor [Clostridioides sp. ZZV13-5731]
MLNIVICEDDFIFRDKLKVYVEVILKDIDKQFEIITFNCGEDLIENYPEDTHIFFLDIEMDKLSGMDIARKIREVDCNSEIIFTTAVVDYIQDGYEVRAYRYLIKPIEFNELKKHVLSCVEDLTKRNENNLIIQNKGTVYKISIDSITYIEVRDKDITIHTIDQSYDIKKSLSKIEKELNERNCKFYRCHKSYLVNMNHIQYIKQNVVLVNNAEIPVSRSKIKDFKIKLANVLGDIIC